MALLKRRKKPKPVKPLPGREVRCRRCSKAVHCDDNLEAGHPKYACPSCGAHYPPTPEEEWARIRALDEGRNRAAARRASAGARKSKGLPVIWCEPTKSTPEQRAGARKSEESGERMINKILSKDFRPAPAGRKRDPAYDKADYRAKVQELRGKKVSPQTLAREILADDKSSEECKVDKMRQALKRRKRK